MPRHRSSATRLNAVAALFALLAAPLPAQQLGFTAATIEPSPGIRITDTGPLRVPIAVRIRRGYHINSDKPNDPYLIPTSLDWPGVPLRIDSVAYPPPEEVKYDFSDKPLSVYSSRVEIVTTFHVESVPADTRELRGSFRFQACNDKACLPPKTLPVRVPVRR
ncbi:MAG: protein-disulfide reductase DsbD family protein [Bryobacterales bacterium]|nr:protein-disulfide reductase DsbD family protein [Bryobacterales bacterium]